VSFGSPEVDEEVATVTAEGVWAEAGVRNVKCTMYNVQTKARREIIKNLIVKCSAGGSLKNKL